MEENEVIEQTEELEPEVEVSEEDLNAFDEDWSDDSDDDDDWDLSDDEETSDEDEEQGDEDAEPAEEGTESGNQRFKINYLGNEEELTLEQMTELAQKGRDYDHVREERDKLRGESGKYADAERQLAFLQELAEKAGVTVDEQIDLTKAMWLMDAEADKGNSISESEALLRVQRDKKTAPSAKGQEEQQEDNTDYTPQIDRFLKIYPNVAAQDIPQEVWDAAKAMGGDLLGAYQTHLIRELRSENERTKKEAQNNKNGNRSTGSRKSAGAGKPRDDFDDGWDS